MLHLRQLLWCDSKETYTILRPSNQLVFLKLHRSPDTCFIVFTAITIGIIRLNRVVQTSRCSLSLLLRSWTTPIHFSLSLLRIICLCSCRLIPVVLLQKLDDLIDILATCHGTQVLYSHGHLGI